MTLADSIVVLNGGHVEQFGTPMELYNTPASRFVAGFIGSPRMNFIEGPPAQAQGAACLAIRPEHLDLAVSGGLWPGEVVMAEALGSDTFIHVATPEAGRLVVRVEGQEKPAIGTAVGLTPRKGATHAFDTAGRPLTRTHGQGHDKPYDQDTRMKSCHKRPEARCFLLC